MTQSKLFFILSKFFGVYCFIKSLEYFSQMLVMRSSFHGEMTPVFYLGYLAPMWIFLLVSFLFIFQTQFMTEKLLKVDTDVPLSTDLELKNWYIFTLASCGILLLFWKVPPQIIKLIINFLYRFNSNDISEIFLKNIFRNNILLVINIIVNVVLGTYLIRYSDKLVNFLLSKHNKNT